MTKMKKHQVDDAIKYYREIGKLAFKSNINQNSVIKNSGNNESKLLKMMAEDRSQIDRLNIVIDMKQREIDELNKKEMDLLWKLAHLEKDNGALQEYKDNNEKEIGYWEKKITNFVKNKKDN